MPFHDLVNKTLFHFKSVDSHRLRHRHTAHSASSHYSAMGSDSTDTNDCTFSVTVYLGQIDPGSYCFRHDVKEKAGSGIKISGLPYGGDMVCESPIDTIKDRLTDIIAKRNSFSARRHRQALCLRPLAPCRTATVFDGVPMVSKITADDTITVSTTPGHYKTTCQGTRTYRRVYSRRCRGIRDVTEVRSQFAGIKTVCTAICKTSLFSLY